MIVVRTRSALAEALAPLKQGGHSVGFVPTMGYLHEGHLSLVDRAGTLADHVVASIFVNPLQFSPSEDLSTYPRNEARDIERLEARGTELVFAPSVDEMYPDGDPVVTVSAGAMGRRLCGAFRPGHFNGILTVVARLFGLVRPDVVVFGRKDLQQAALVRRMVRDLELGVRVEIVPTVRETDGVAMSSRNAYLSADERDQAPVLYESLLAARQLVVRGEHRSRMLLDEVKRRLAGFPLVELQYVEAVDPDTLENRDEAVPGSVVALAAFCGTTRLIDNLEL